jgi:hypothetical protein
LCIDRKKFRAEKHCAQYHPCPLGHARSPYFGMTLLYARKKASDTDTDGKARQQNGRATETRFASRQTRSTRNEGATPIGDHEDRIGSVLGTPRQTKNVAPSRSVIIKGCSALAFLSMRQFRRTISGPPVEHNSRYSFLVATVTHTLYLATEGQCRGR